MTFDDFLQRYALNDGEMLSIHMDYKLISLALKLQVRSSLGKDKFKPCEVHLEFRGLSKVDFFEDFPTNGAYSDITFIKQGEDFYLSLDPFGNSGLQHDEDNLTVIARELVVIDDQGVRHSIVNT